MRTKKLEKGHLLKCLFGVVRDDKKLEGHLLKCPFGVVRKAQKSKKGHLFITLEKSIIEDDQEHKHPSNNVEE